MFDFFIYDDGHLDWKRVTLAVMGFIIIVLCGILGFRLYSQSSVPNSGSYGNTKVSYDANADKVKYKVLSVKKMKYQIGTKVSVSKVFENKIPAAHKKVIQKVYVLSNGVQLAGNPTIKSDLKKGDTFTYGNTRAYYQYTIKRVGIDKSVSKKKIGKVKFIDMTYPKSNYINGMNLDAKVGSVYTFKALSEKINHQLYGNMDNSENIYVKAGLLKQSSLSIR